MFTKWNVGIVFRRPIWSLVSFICAGTSSNAYQDLSVLEFVNTFQPATLQDLKRNNIPSIAASVPKDHDTLYSMVVPGAAPGFPVLAHRLVPKPEAQNMAGIECALEQSANPRITGQKILSGVLAKYPVAASKNKTTRSGKTHQ